MNPSLPIHPPEETIERYVRGRLPDAELDTFEEHLLSCVPCQRSAEELDIFVRATKAAAQKLEHPPARREWPWSMLNSGPRVAWTVALIAAAALIMVIPARNPGSQAISLAATRGGESSVHARAKVPINLTLDIVGLASASEAYRVEVVDSAGKNAGTYTAAGSGEKIAVKIPQRLDAGQYWVRLYSPGKNELLREYGLTVE